MAREPRDDPLAQITQHWVEEAAPPRVLQAFLRRKREPEQEVIVASRKVSAKKRKAAAVIKLAVKKARLAKEALKAKKVKVAVALALLPKKFLAGELGQGHKEGGSAVHRANRVSMLNRLKLRCPPLDPEWEARWDVFAVRHVRRTGTDHKGAIGVFALGEVREVMEALGKHLRHESGKDLSGGTAKATPEHLIGLSAAIGESLRSTRMSLWFDERAVQTRMHLQ